MNQTVGSLAVPFCKIVDEEIQLKILRTFKKINQLFLIQLLLVIGLSVISYAVGVRPAYTIIGYQIIDHIGMVAMMISISRLISKFTPYLEYFQKTRAKIQVIQTYIIGLMAILTIDLIVGIMGDTIWIIYPSIGVVSIVVAIIVGRELRIALYIFRSLINRKIIGMMGLYGVLTGVSVSLNLYI